MKVDKELIKKVANLARLELDNSECEVFVKDFSGNGRPDLRKKFSF